MVVDWVNHLNEESNCTIVLSTDKDRYEKLILELFKWQNNINKIFKGKNDLQNVNIKTVDPYHKWWHIIL